MTKTSYQLVDSDLGANSYGLRPIILSGNYFITLATQLDELKNQLKKHKQNKAEVVSLEVLIDQLIYIQSTYKINTKKI